MRCVLNSDNSEAPVSRVKGEASTTTDTKPDVEFNCDFEAGECGWQTGTTSEQLHWERLDAAQCEDNYPGMVGTWTYIPCNIYTPPPQCPGAGSEDSTHWMYLSGAAGGATDAATLISPESQPPTGDCFMFMFNLPVTVIMS